MKYKRTVLLLTVAVTMGLLLGTSAAQAETVLFDPDFPTRALGIEDLEFGGTLYDVDFILGEVGFAYDSGFPYVFDFPTSSAAQAAVIAVNAALTAAGALSVGQPGAEDVDFSTLYEVGWRAEKQDLAVASIVSVWQGTIIDLEPWQELSDFTFSTDPRWWAKFTLVGPPPDPVTIGGSVSGLEGSGLVLQNNGGDDLPITENGPFTFDTAVTPHTTYDVTVATYPTDQICIVSNGSGGVPLEDVTDVAVLCTAAVVSDVTKVAAEGDTLPDSNVLSSILLDGGVAINIDGQVAFGGRDGGGIEAVFTQDRKVVTEGETLPDGTTVAAFRGQGEVAINAGQLDDLVAFHGEAQDRGANVNAVFTQAGKVAAEGDAIDRDTTVSEIDPAGKVAINSSDEAAFHGRVEVEGGLIGDERYPVVFISDGVTTREAAREESNLPDGTPLEVIASSGGVAISELGEVAFHGKTGGVKAVFTSEKLAAKVGDTLPDGEFVDDIDVDGGVAINVLGEVAFHGNADDDRSVIAVFTSKGKVATVGSLTTGGAAICSIDPSGGVAISLFGEVAFHGFACVAGGIPIKAVFVATQDTIHVVANVGDLLADGALVDDIDANGGVAINLFGEVAFHGKVGATDAVFVGLAP